MNKIDFPEKPTLVLMCKRPQLGQGKQRLAATFGRKRAMHMALGLLRCALEDARHWNGPLALAVAHEEDLAWAKNLFSCELSVLYQGEGNLGERINRVDHQLRQQGHKSLVFIGTDAPILTAKHYHQVKLSLMSHDAVFVPAEDGGVVVMANRAPWPNLEELPWSTDKLGNQLSQCCQNHQLATANVSSGYDIDEEKDVYRLKEDLKLDERPARNILLRILKKSIHQIEEARRA